MANMMKRAVFALDKRLFPKTAGDEAEQIVYDGIMSGKPFMAARLGAVESKALLYAKLKWPFSLLLKSYTYANMHRNAGFFPVREDTIRRFADLMTEAMQLTDVLGSWRPEEAFFRKELRNAQKITLGTIAGPHETSCSWTRALRGKHVLVVHPFAETIERQYRENRARLFANPDILPELASLQTVKAVQTIAGNDAGYSDWFAALDHMKREIDRHRYDVCILGCGAYGYPLAAHVKEMGGVSLHLGGPVQLYFGIKGKRWDHSGLYNEFWVSPAESERPKNLEKVENGCYW